jgi:predicted AlkP superfamily phosphohydrolase/phosphomutase
MRPFNKVIVLGLDGLEPKVADRLLAAGELPHLARLRAAGGYARVATTCPAQTPVAWSTFATGTNPGGHGIFDFIRRDPRTRLPDLALNRYEQKSLFLPPQAVKRRRGTPLWELLGAAGVPSIVLRCPCAYPPDPVRGREEGGVVAPEEAEGLKRDLAEALSGLEDAERGPEAIRALVPRERVYSGPHTGEAPDLVVHFAEGYRVSWATVLGGVPEGSFEDNRRKWSGDHIIDPALVPGVLLINRPFRGDGTSLVDLAPTILVALGVPKGPALEGSTLLS